MARESPVAEQIKSSIDREALAEMALEILKIPSPTGEEAAVALYIGDRFRDLGFRVQIQEVEVGRPNVICTLKGSGGGTSLMLTGHMDADTPPGFTEATGTEDGWMYGTGASNMKGFFAAAYGAAKALIEAGADLIGDLLISAVIGELECGPVDVGEHSYQGARYRAAGVGTEFMLRNGIMPDMAIIGEPTGLRVQCGNTGYVFANIEVFGKAMHTQHKRPGASGLDKMLYVAQAIQRWEPEYQRLYRHPRMEPRINIGAISAGRPYKPNVSPRSAHIFAHITTTPGASPLVLKRQIEEVVAAAGVDDPEFKAEVSFYMIRSGYELPSDEFLAQVVRYAHEDVLGKSPEPIEPGRYSVSSDGPFFHQYGVPAITYGPGGVTPDGARMIRDELTGREWLSHDNLATCAQVYALSALSICGGNG